MEEKLYIQGGTPLRGTVTVSGAKNSAVALIPASILADSPVIIDNLPMINDVHVYIEILEELGASVQWENDSLCIDPRGIRSLPLPNGKVQKLRASYYLMGAMLGRFGEAKIGLPGGCDLGPRPIDQHMKGFETLGAEIEPSQGMLSLKVTKPHGGKVYLDIVSVGATINIMLAAARSPEVTVIENAAKEPEIIDVATLLTSMGAVIKGAGTDEIRITGNPKLTGCRHSIIPDRIEAGTYMIAAAATKGDVTIEQVIPRHLEGITAKLEEMGIQVIEGDESIRVCVQSGDTAQAVNVRTGAYPGFATDLQQPMTALLCLAEGTSVVTDSIYGSRFGHVDELVRMGAKVRSRGSSAMIEGVKTLKGTEVQASDLRAGACLVIAGLAAEGVTMISGVQHIDRGYDMLEDKMKALGAKVWRK